MNSRLACSNTSKSSITDSADTPQSGMSALITLNYYLIPRTCLRFVRNSSYKSNSMGLGNSATTGGCSCGVIRYAISGPPDQILVCHCPDCRRAVGAQSVAWIFLSIENFSVTQGTLTAYNSSRGVTRSFCGKCGTTISWVGDKQPGRIDVTIGSLDNPDQFVPTRAVYKTHKLAWASLI